MNEYHLPSKIAHSPNCCSWLTVCVNYSANWRESTLLSTDPCESEICAPPQLTIALKLSYYLFIITKLFKVKDGCLKFVYNIKIPGLWHF